MSALPSPSPAGTYPTSPPNGFRMDAKRIRYHRGGHSRQENLRARGRARMRNTVGVKAGPKAKGACRRNAGHMIRAGALLAAPITLLCAVPRSSGVPASAATCRQAKNRASTEEAAIRLAGPQTRTAPVTFYRDVLPILQRHCEACHRAGGIAPMAFETYAETKPFAEAIRAATQADHAAVVCRSNGGEIFERFLAFRRRNRRIGGMGRERSSSGRSARSTAAEDVGRELDDSTAGSRAEDAAGSAAAGERRCRIYLRNRAHAFCRGPLGANVRSAAFRPNERASRRGVHSAADFELAAARACRQGVHRVRAERSRGAAQRALDDR